MVGCSVCSLYNHTLFLSLIFGFFKNYTPNRDIGSVKKRPRAFPVKREESVTDIISNLNLGFSIALTPYNVFFCFIGVIFGTLVGVLPGLGPVASISLLLPVTYQMQPVTAIIMLAGIFYGAQYGGSTTSILVNIPGESSSVVTCLDGYQMARQGRAGPALGISAFGSFIAGTLGVVGLMFFAPPLGRAALSIGPPEYFALTFFGLTLVTALSRGPTLNALIMATLGLFAGCIGADPISGYERYTFGSLTLLDGVGIVPVAMGMFGIGEVLENVASAINTRDIYETKIKGLFPTLRDWKDSSWSIIRGIGIGFFVGILPGPSVTISTFASYAIEKKLSRYPEKFGTGMIEGVAGPESANNAATSGAFIPMISLGIPANVTMALFMGALMIHGIQPGPLFIGDHPDIFWGFIASMYIGNVMLLILNLPLIGMWVRVLRISYDILFPLILLFCLIGAYTIGNNVVELFVMLVFGILGYLNRKIGFEGAPFVLALVLGPMMERSLRQSLVISQGSFGIFFMRPISAIMLGLGIASVVFSIFPTIIKKRINESEEAG
jgi:putative tricarboxylic transport membrane protein